MVSLCDSPNAAPELSRPCLARQRVCLQQGIARHLNKESHSPLSNYLGCSYLGSKAVLPAQPLYIVEDEKDIDQDKGLEY
jgi:hypothetical protein